MTPIPVLIAAHEPLFRDGLRRALEARGEYVVDAEHDRAPHALEDAARRRPAAVLLDIHPPVICAREELRGFIRACSAPVVAVVHSPLEGLFALAEGARGVWSRSADATLLLEAIRAATSGEVWVGPRTMRVLAAELRDRQERDRREARLTRREREVLSTLEECVGVRELAARFFTSPHTMKTHLRHLEEKLSLRDRADLQRYAEERSLRESLLDGCLKTLQSAGMNIGPDTGVRGGAPPTDSDLRRWGPGGAASTITSHARCARRARRRQSRGICGPQPPQGAAPACSRAWPRAGERGKRRQAAALQRGDLKNGWPDRKEPPSFAANVTVSVFIHRISRSLNRSDPMPHPRTLMILPLALGLALTARAAIASPPAFSLAQTLNNPAMEDGDMFGHSVDLVGDDLLVGAPLTNMGGTNTGAAYLFDSSGKLLRTFQQPNPAAGDWFGNEVAAVGANVLIGDLGDDSAAHDAGAAFLFDSKTGKVLLTLQEPTPHDGDWFGASVAAAGPNLLVGAPLDHVGGVSGGGAYLFDGSTGKLLQSFHKPNPGDGEWFGVSMAAVGDNVLIGAFLDNTGASAAGAAYLFDSKTGALLHTLQAPKPADNGQFGIAVAAMGNTLVVGAPGANSGQPDAGAVYLFDATTGQWLRTLKAPTPVQGELFGSSVAVAGMNILVGAPGKEATQSGAAYLFDGQTGALLQRFQNTTPAGGDMFGFWLAAAPDRLLIAAPGDHAGSNLGGAAFLYK